MKTDIQIVDAVSIRGLFGRVMSSMLLVWVVLAVVFSVAVYFSAIELIWPASFIAVMSGLISICALIPGMALTAPQFPVESKLSRQQRIQRSGLFLVGVLATMIIRAVGTVALLVLCRYQMVLPVETIVLFVCGWYIALTAFEVYWLAQKATALNAVSSEVPLAATDALVDGTDF
jgi:hypothetical protein